MFRDLTELKQRLKDVELDSLKDIIISSSRPAIDMALSPMRDNDIPVGKSKLGGKPDLPSDFQWPYHQETPLTFIGQFNLEGLAEPEQFSSTPVRVTNQLTLWDMNTIPTAEPRYVPQKLDETNLLPKTGILYFFYDDLKISYNELDSWYIAYQEDMNNLVRTSPPKFTYQKRHLRVLPPHRVQFVEKLMIPSGLYIEKNDLKFLSDDEARNYYEMYWEQEGARPWHHFYGYPRHIQGEIEWDCVTTIENISVDYVNHSTIYTDKKGKAITRKELEAMKSEWHFLFQIGSDDSLEVLWGDSGILYVCIPKKSLQQRRFEDCCIVMQCH